MKIQDNILHAKLNFDVIVQKRHSFYVDYLLNLYGCNMQLNTPSVIHHPQGEAKKEINKGIVNKNYYLPDVERITSNMWYQ